MKNLIKSKTIWTGLGSIVTGVGLIFYGNQPEGLQLIFSGLSAIFLRRAMMQ